MLPALPPKMEGVKATSDFRPVVLEHHGTTEESGVATLRPLAGSAALSLEAVTSLSPSESSEDSAVGERRLVVAAGSDAAHCSDSSAAEQGEIQLKIKNEGGKFLATRWDCDL